MKRIGLIDNLVNIRGFVENAFHKASAAEVMTATGGNTGNVAFVFGATQLIGNPIVRLSWGTPVETVRKQVDQLVVCCANQLGAHADLAPWADRLEQFGLPVTLLGLGAQSDSYDVAPVIPDGTMRFLKTVQELRPDAGATNIGVRGAFTRRCLADLGIEATATGCPSLLISPHRDLGRLILGRQRGRDVQKVAVAAGNPWHGESAFLEKVLVDVVDHYRSAYVLQHPESMLQFAFGERDKIAERTREHFLKVYGDRFDFESLLEWFRRNAFVFADAPNWMRFLMTYDLVIGPRYHGVALALQAGVPGCVFTIDSRTTELCEETTVKAVPAASLKSLAPDAVVEASRWSAEDADRFDANRQAKTATIGNFFESNGINPSQQLRGLAG